MRAERTRFAPSPTGMLHIGGLRTALYAYFLAKQTGGDFVLRIEDTDQARAVEGGVENIVEPLDRVGIQADEGFIWKDGRVTERGKFGPYLQSKRLAMYRAAADSLVQEGKRLPLFLLFRTARRCTRETAGRKTATQIRSPLS